MTVSFTPPAQDSRWFMKPTGIIKAENVFNPQNNVDINSFSHFSSVNFAIVILRFTYKKKIIKFKMQNSYIYRTFIGWKKMLVSH